MFNVVWYLFAIMLEANDWSSEHSSSTQSQGICIWNNGVNAVGEDVAATGILRSDCHKEKQASMPNPVTERMRVLQTLKWGYFPGVQGVPFSSRIMFDRFCQLPKICCVWERYQPLLWKITLKYLYSFRSEVVSFLKNRSISSDFLFFVKRTAADLQVEILRIRLNTPLINLG